MEQNLDFFRALGLNWLSLFFLDAEVPTSIPIPQRKGKEMLASTLSTEISLELFCKDSLSSSGI